MAKNDVGEEVCQRILSVGKFYYSLQKHMRSRTLTKATKILINKTLIRPDLIMVQKRGPSQGTWKHSCAFSKERF